MYCRQCGRKLYDDTEICPYCSTPVSSMKNNKPKDRTYIVFGILGFFIPLVGLILYLVLKDSNPRNSKAAGKGAIAGFVANIIFSIIYFVVILLFTGMFIDGGYVQAQTPNDTIEILTEAIDESQENQVDINIGELKVTNNGYYNSASLDVTVRNTSVTQKTYYITIEAVNENGTRLMTDTVSVSRLNPGQDIVLSAFEYIEPERIEEFKNAEFKVLDIEQFDF